MESETSNKRRLKERTMHIMGRERASAKDLVRFRGSTDAMNDTVIANGMMAGKDEKVAALATVKKVATLAMSKAINKIRTTVKDQEMFGRATSLEKKEASYEIAMSLERRSKSELETVEVVCLN